MIIKISNILKNNCKNGDLFRIGGDEFYIFLYQSDENKVKEFIENVNSDCEKVFIDLNFVSISLGYHIIKDATDTLDSALNKAEADMYYMKSLTSESIKNKSIACLKNIFQNRYKNEKTNSDRLIKVAKDFAICLDLRESEIQDLCNSIELMDIGKVAINHSIYGKGIFNVEDEFENMKKHCRIGYKIASLSYETSHLARIILNHHENWDGSGFPQGLKEKRIPYLTRIIRIIVYYDNILSNNPTVNLDLICNEIDNKKGNLFDPLLADLFIVYLKSKMK